VPVVLKSGTLNFLEPSGPVQACNGIAFCRFYVERETFKGKAGPLIVSINLLASRTAAANLMGHWFEQLQVFMTTETKKKKNLGPFLFQLQ
jgi:hypothetical protein